MIAGTVDGFGRALIPLGFCGEPDDPETVVSVWIDTGFTGEMLLPRSLIDRMSLPRSSNVEARLADGTVSSYDTYSAHVDWFGDLREVEVIEGMGPFPLLGARLMLGFRLEVNYSTLTVAIDRPA